MLDRSAFIADLEAMTKAPAQQSEEQHGTVIDIRIDRGLLPDCARLLLEHEFYLNFLTPVHVSPVCEVLYRFGHFEAPCSIVLRVSAGEDGCVPSIAAVYQGADWHEREAHDFFGITFTGHPNLKPLILTRDESNFKPLLKPDERLKSCDDIFSSPEMPQEP